MQKRTHLAFALFLGSIAFALGLPLSSTILIGVSAFFPDIDWLMDKIWFKPDSVFKRLWHGVFKQGMHRTILHNIWALLVFVLIIGYFSVWSLIAMLAVFIGYVSHLIMDSMTKTGIHWLWPYGDKKTTGTDRFYVKGNITTGKSKGEVTVRQTSVVLGSVALGYGLNGGLVELNFSGLLNILTYIFVGIIVFEILLTASTALTKVFSFPPQKRKKP